MKSELSPRGRCFRCGRFVKRGLFNSVRHYWDECPEKQIILFSLDPTKCKLIKLKDMKK
jgi:hypothetical protein